MFQFPVKRGSMEEMAQAIEDLEKKGFKRVSEIVQVVDGKRVSVNDDYLYSQFIVKMGGERK